jgi:hypothetical protein
VAPLAFVPTVPRTYGRDITPEALELLDAVIRGGTAEPLKRLAAMEVRLAAAGRLCMQRACQGMAVALPRLAVKQVRLLASGSCGGVQGSGGAGAAELRGREVCVSGKGSSAAGWWLPVQVEVQVLNGVRDEMEDVRLLMSQVGEKSYGFSLCFEGSVSCLMPQMGLAGEHTELSQAGATVLGSLVSAQVSAQGPEGLWV